MGYRSQARARVNKSEVHRGVIVQTLCYGRYQDGRSIGSA